LTERIKDIRLVFLDVRGFPEMTAGIVAGHTNVVAGSHEVGFKGKGMTHEKTELKVLVAGDTGVRRPAVR
jgi:hypothetical protein